MIWLFAFFFLSGFCSILYEVVWLRLAMAYFGVTSALVSIVLSVFMAGLGLGAWASGYLIRQYGDRFKQSALRLYALIELLIGVSAILVPHELALGRSLLEHLGLSSSGGYYLVSGIWVGLSLIPWCACMGATIPVAMLWIRNRYSGETGRSFSYLYLANVLGATLGTVLPLLIIEIHGFRGTLRVGACLNALLALSATIVGRRLAGTESIPSPEHPGVETLRTQPTSNPRLLLLLFLGGLTSMGAEVVWIRQFTPYLGTMVYAFASILGVYLISTFTGSWIYRRWSKVHDQENALLWALLGLAAILPVVTADPTIAILRGVQGFHTIMGGVRVALGVAPFSALLGFLTPMLVDRWSGGDPDKAGRAYAVNVVGCILGPLLAGFVLLPLLNERWVLFIFCVPWLGVGLNPNWSGRSAKRAEPIWKRGVPDGMVLLAVVLAATTHSYETKFPKYALLRDSTATTIAAGEGRDRQLLVNGRGMTGLTPITKMMAHLPLASLNRQPTNALVVCFGMGTTFRSMLSWGIDTTAVELVPSVPRLFWYYQDDAMQLMNLPRAHIEIDDGRRYLERTSQQFDVIAIDPPPPVQSAGSSLLYSKEFYSTIKMRLKPGGILQQWLPKGDAEVQAAVARALMESFPYVRAFHSVKGWGLHFLASDVPITRRSADELVQRMPPAAVEDMMEWGPYQTPSLQFSAMLDTELPVERLFTGAPQTVAMQDDKPVNEYFLLRFLKKGKAALE